MKRAAEALPVDDVEPEPFLGDENTSGPKDRTHRIVVLTRKVRGLIGIVKVRIRQPSGATVDVEGLGLPHALRRLAELVEREQAVGPLEQTECRRMAIAAIDEAARELWRIAGLVTPPRCPSERSNRSAHPSTHRAPSRSRARGGLT